jgi:nucleoside phosphorylase
VGWICALPNEFTAAMAMLDKFHPPLKQDASDYNAYTLGSIGEHNVAIACLPAGQMGNNSAAVVASQMKYSFASIRFGLMVGIGGGVPSPRNDIRLGDIVVSEPTAQNGGVVQYDFGQTLAQGRFIHTGSLNAPPTVLLAALNKLQAMHILHGNQLAQHLSKMNTPNLQQNFTYQGVEHDQLFEADYDHVGGGSICEDCDISRLVARPPRESPDPVIHYGTIASGNQVMQHGVTRDRLRQEHGILCFEMEAAGLMNSFPCIVIRGVCDYSDSHKNKRWQPYAAATSAAYAKELLSIMPTSEVEKTPSVADMGKSPLQDFKNCTISKTPF